MDNPHVFRVEVNYKSGTRIQFDVTKFRVSREPRVTFEWIDVGSRTPLYFNATDVESVWQVADLGPLDEYRKSI
jgi:hypothetical protein